MLDAHLGRDSLSESTKSAMSEPRKTTRCSSDVAKRAIARWHDVSFGNVVAVHLYERSPARRLRLLVYSFLYGFHLEVEGISHAESGPVFFYSSGRKKRSDLRAMFDRARGLVNGATRTVELMERATPLQLLRTCAYLPRAFTLVPRTVGTWMDVLLLRMLVAKYLSAVPALRSTVMSPNATAVITFCDAFPYDNLVAQLATARGLPTYTIQHGQYRVLQETNLSADAEAYLNFISNYMFCWGEATIKELGRAGLPRERFICVGRLRERSPGPVVGSVPAGTKVVMGVIFNGENAKAANYELLNAAKVVSRELGIQYFVRFHPANQASDYDLEDAHCIESRRFTDDEYFEKATFSIAHMSSVVVESLERAHRVFVLKNDLLADVFVVDGLSFTASELPEAIHEFVEQDWSANREHCARLARWFNDDSQQKVVLGRLGCA